MDSINLAPMEKRSPHYRLADIQAIVARTGLQAFTATAVFNAAAMGLSESQAVATIASLSRSMFYKSMTTHADHTVWQDVYHAPTPVGKTAYIKLTLKEGAAVIQFKEK